MNFGEISVEDGKGIRTKSLHEPKRTSLVKGSGANHFKNISPK